MSSLSHLPLSPHRLFALPLPSANTNCGVPRHCRLSICASSVKKPRASRKLKSDADLCKDIREFVSAVGLPEGHVPSMKELSQHGRQDLANIVRRRGYKLVKELLATSTKTDKKESATGKGLTANQDTATESQYEEVEVTANNVLSSSEDSFNQIQLNSVDGATSDFSSTSERDGCMGVKSSTSSSLRERVAKFVQNGVLDAVEDDGEGFGRSDIGDILNVTMLSSKQVAVPASGKNTTRDDVLSSEESRSTVNDDELDIETRKRESQREIDHLKLMLHQKELELSQLKEEIENEKLALSRLQMKAEAEISKAQKCISDKDAELHDAEQGLSGLKEVQIEYWGDSEIVELAGSFNGWHHRIRMEAQSASSISDPIGSRKSRLWTTVLWLYPGTYEIKFIIDGHWRIDPQRESVTKGSIQNNVLRVGG
ncbi:hypothetical protein NMG60_11000624 [Bertholletia excelsa]